jgi:hypothetical protein
MVIDRAAVPITAAPHSGPKCFTIFLNITTLLYVYGIAGPQPTRIGFFD